VILQGRSVSIAATVGNSDIGNSDRAGDDMNIEGTTNTGNPAPER
jgi:hypothetical protein